jgi:hypothetical protein
MNPEALQELRRVIEESLVFRAESIDFWGNYSVKWPSPTLCILRFEERVTIGVSVSQRLTPEETNRSLALEGTPAIAVSIRNDGITIGATDEKLFATESIVEIEAAIKNVEFEIVDVQKISLRKLSKSFRL